jgi:glutathione synthase/RimK-type ligase-like ATP-grasp enzyme
LRDLSEAGVPIVPTEWYEQGATPHLAKVMSARGWREAIAKPAISSTAFRTWRIPGADASEHENAFHTLLHERAAMLQEFQPDILQGGEWSVMLIAGAHSHTVVKRATTGDFRVQEEYGGTTEAVTPPPDLLRLARRAADVAPGQWLYARIDAVQSAEGFRVMELEMLEPGMFFLNDATAAERFAAGVLERL